MTLQQLKESILDGTIDNEFLILHCKQNTFIAKQYINEICSVTGKTKNTISSLRDTQESAFSLVFDFSNRLNILEVDEFNEKSDAYYKYTDTIVVCKTIDKKIAPLLANYIVEIPELTDWQIQAYIKANCPGLSTEDCVKLCTLAQKDIYRIDNEIAKIALYVPQKQHAVLAGLICDEASDLYYMHIFTLTDAIYKRNLSVVYDWLKHIDYVDVEPIGLVKMMLDHFKKVAFAVFNSQKSPEELGLTKAQAYAIKQNYNNYNISQVINAIDFLSHMDVKLKDGWFDLPKNQQSTYLVSRILSILGGN